MERPVIYEKLLTGATAVQTASTNVGSGQLSRARELSVYVHFRAGSTVGVVVVETAHDPTFTGTWANLATVTWAAADRVHHVAITGVHMAVRVRITTAVDGAGTDAHLVGN